MENHGFSHGFPRKMICICGLKPWCSWLFHIELLVYRIAKPQGWPTWMNRTGNIGDLFTCTSSHWRSLVSPLTMIISWIVLGRLISRHTGHACQHYKRDGQRPSGLSTKTSLEYINNQWSCLNGYVTCWFSHISQLLNSSICVDPIQCSWSCLLFEGTPS